MKIGLDYGGVISFSPDGWGKTLLKAVNNGHKIFLISHVQPDATEQIQMRVDFTNQISVVNLTFSDLDWYTQKTLVVKRKAELCIQHDIELFIDDDLSICQGVSELSNRCAVLYTPINLWQIGQRLIDGLAADD